MNRVFIDTNIVVDLLDTTRVHSANSREVVKFLTVEGVEIVISEDILTTVYYIVKNKKEVLRFFQAAFRHWKVVGFGFSILAEATELCLERGVDFEDVLQSLCAKHQGCDMIITNDTDFYGCGVPVCSSKEFLIKYDRRNI